MAVIGQVKCTPAQNRVGNNVGKAGSVILLPGLPLLAAGVERHPVPGGGSRTVANRRPVTKSQSRTETASSRAKSPSSTAPAVPRSGCARACSLQDTRRRALPTRVLYRDNPVRPRSVRRPACRRCGCDLGDCGRAPDYSPGMDPGQATAWRGTASGDGTLIVSAPAEADGSRRGKSPVRNRPLRPASISPAQPRRGSRHRHSLAEPVQDSQSRAGKCHGIRGAQRDNSFRYSMSRAGSVQIFRLGIIRALDRGVVHDIDPTTTRSLDRQSRIPGPGIFSKYFSVEHAPVDGDCPGHGGQA